MTYKCTCGKASFVDVGGEENRYPCKGCLKKRDAGIEKRIRELNDKWNWPINEI